MTTNNLAVMCAMQNNFERAEALFRQNIKNMVAKYGNSHIAPLQTMENLAFLLLSTQRLHEAEVVALECVDTSVRVFGDQDQNHPVICGCRERLHQIKREEENILELSQLELDIDSLPLSVTCASHEHTLQRCIVSYPEGRFNCDICKTDGLKWAYSCSKCGFDGHLRCCVTSLLSTPLSVTNAT
jgi:hypothetical protein